MLENLEHMKENFKDLEKKLADPEVLSDTGKFKKVSREYNQLKPVVEKYDQIKESEGMIDENKELLKEAEEDEMIDLLKSEINENKKKLEQYNEELKILLIPKDPNDHKDVIVEIRAGAGGEEAGLFAGNLYRMYHMYADKQNYQTEDIDISSQGVGGVKEATFIVRGEGAYSKLKYESGVHRVQRVPETESGGRIHTSTATVAVLPEADEVDLNIAPNDIRVDVYRASGNGGQHVNTTDSAVRLTHEPTGLVVTCQDEKSQTKNKDKAMKVLRTRLYEMEEQKRQKEISDSRKSQVGTGDRSERIRTYNYPQGRITDHRINKTIYQLEDFLDGNIEDMIESLITEDQARKLETMGEE